VHLLHAVPASETGCFERANHCKCPDVVSTLALYVIFPTSGHGSGQAKPKPGQSQGTWLGLEILEAKATQSQAKATGFQAKPSQNITTSD
jgi:hypothetical protein